MNRITVDEYVEKHLPCADMPKFQGLAKKFRETYADKVNYQSDWNKLYSDWRRVETVNTCVDALGLDHDEWENNAEQKEKVIWEIARLTKYSWLSAKQYVSLALEFKNNPFSQYKA